MATSLVARQEGSVTENLPGPPFVTPNCRLSRMRRTSAGSSNAAEFAGEPVEIERRRRRLAEFGVIVGKTADQAHAGREQRQKFDGAGQGADGVVRILRFFETHGCVGAEFEGDRGFADAGGVEIGAFENDGSGGVRNGAVAAADDSGDGDGAGGIGNDQVRRCEVVLFFVERDDFFAVAGRAGEDGVAGELVAIERVHGLREFGHDVVREIDDVVDRIQADRGQAVLQPERRGLDGDVFENQGAVTRAEREIFDFDFDRAAGPGKRLRLTGSSSGLPVIAATSRAMPW